MFALIVVDHSRLSTMHHITIVISSLQPHLTHAHTPSYNKLLECKLLYIYLIILIFSRTGRKSPLVSDTTIYVHWQVECSHNVEQCKYKCKGNDQPLDTGHRRMQQQATTATTTGRAWALWNAHAAIYQCPLHVFLTSLYKGALIVASCSIIVLVLVLVNCSGGCNYAASLFNLCLC